MADENTDSTTPAETQNEQPEQQTQQPEQQDSLGESGKKAIAEERKARRDAEKQLRDLSARLQQFEDANKSETDKLNDRATRAEQQATDTLARYHALVKRQAITDAAATAQTTDPETVYLYLRDEVEVTDDGDVTGIDKALKTLQQRKPHLFRTVPAGTRDATAGGTPPALNSDALTDALKRAVGAS